VSLRDQERETEDVRSRDQERAREDASGEAAMRAKWVALAAVLAVGAGYFGYPYMTLWRLHAAMRQADAQTLGTMVDWYSVREGLKEDLADAGDDAASLAERPNNELAPFGQSFVRGITGGFVDKRVTPETVAAMPLVTGADQQDEPRVVSAFFNSPMRFEVTVRAGGAAEPVHLELELRDLRWRVCRVRLPSELLRQMSTGT
jgi:hypothetical protein